MLHKSVVYCLLQSVMMLTLAAQAVHSADSWQSSDPGFRPINITSVHGAFWVCGVGEGIASSLDGKSWQIRYRKDAGGALLLGIAFASDAFGYAYGTGGTLLTTEDGGATWLSHHLTEDTILLASLSDAHHGLFRTRQSLFYIDADSVPQPLTQPSDTLKRFSFTPSLVALTKDKMAVLVSEGPFSEAGFLATTNGGKTWSFYDPPSTGITSFLRVGESYWATGHEVVDKDKPGGGHSVPLAMSSADGLRWTHSSNEIKVCHWESCGLCTSEGCLASGTLFIDFFNTNTMYASIPSGVSAKWAKVSTRICTVHSGVQCADLGTPSDVMASPSVPKPSEQSFPSQNAKVATGGLLRCLACAIDPVYVDEKVQGQFKVHVSLLVRSDGTVDTVEVLKAPSEAVQHKMQAQITEWLFEPPMRDGKSVRVASQNDMNISVVRSR